MADFTLRTATAGDAPALHALVCAHLQEGHLLPRAFAEIARHAPRFVVCEREGAISACAELAPLSDSVAEIRSLVVEDGCRRTGIAARLVEVLRQRATMGGFQTLCAFTHDARFFVRQGFSMVPHTWVPAKVAADCLGCPLFRRCGQRAMVLALQSAARRLSELDAPRVAVA